MDEDREYRPVDDETFRRYVRYAFRPTDGPVREAADEASSEEDDGTALERLQRGLYRPGRDDPVAVAVSHDFRSRVRGVPHRLGGISAVATPPEHRRRGYVRDLLSAMLEELRSEEVPFAALWPFERPFYRRLGWETGSRHLRVEAPPARLRTAAAARTGEFNPATADEWELLVPVHEAHDAGRGLHVDRTEAWWRERVFSGWRGDPYVYRWTDDAGETRAYLTYDIEDGDGDEGRTLGVREAAWADPLAARQLWRFLGDHDSQVETVRLTLPFDTEIPLLETVDDPSEATVEIEVGAMVRLTDVASGLSALSYPETADDDLRVAVHDPLVDANDRTFRLAVEGGRATCEPIDDAAVAERPTVSLDVGRLSQLAVGYRDASAMAAAGQLDAPAETVARLDALFPPEPVWLREGF